MQLRPSQPKLIIHSEAQKQTQVLKTTTMQIKKGTSPFLIFFIIFDLKLPLYLIFYVKLIFNRNT